MVQLLAGFSLIGRAEGDILVNCLLKELIFRVLENQSHAEANVPNLFRLCPDIFPMEQYLPLCRLKQTVQMLNQSGFSGAGMSDDS